MRELAVVDTSGGVDDPNFGSRGYFQARSLSSGMSDAGSDPAAAQDFGVPEQDITCYMLEAFENKILYMDLHYWLTIQGE